MAEFSTNAKKRILIVDDDADALEITRHYLEPDYLVGTVSFGKLAIDYVNEYNTDLIIMDVVMPVMDGFQTLKELRALEKGKDIPVIFITGKSSRNIVLESISVGIDGYLVKPFSKEQLVEKTKEILTRQMNAAGKKTVLAIDDDVTYLKIINNSLKDSFNVVMINSTKLAMEYLDNHTPDVVILDYQMPLQSGTALLGYIRRLPKMKDAPVLMMAGMGDREAFMSYEDVKPDKYLIKPISKLDLMKAIITALNDRAKF